ncbi:MAG: polyamine aminopropyltransferase [Chloroflexota bacterium]
MDTDPDSWLQDRISENLIQLHRIQEVLYDGQTRYQHVQIISSSGFGRCLVLDGKIQSTDVDEFIYHEALVQTALIAHPRPEKVFIAGGGEGATLREALSHKTVKRAVMVDIDEEVTALCREYLPGHSRGAFEDGRTELHHCDARDYLAKSDEKFDIIIIDLPDPLEAGPAYRLFTTEFYHIVREHLAGDGIISVQAGSATLTELMNLTAVNNTLKSVFPIVNVFRADVPCFGGPWGFCLASASLNPAELPPEEIDCRIAARGLGRLRFYDGRTHQGMFALPRYLREALARPGRLITDGEPLYAYKSRA